MSVSVRVLSRKLASSVAKVHGGRRDVMMRSMQAVSSRGLQTQTHNASSHQQRQQFLQKVSKNESLFNDMAYSLSFAKQSKDNTNALSSSNFLNAPNELMEQQLVNSQNQLRRTPNVENEWDDAPLPRTLEDALRPSNRAIVITEASVPFRIVDVNTAWEGLCGYSFVECQGKTLGSLLQGPETDRSAVTAVVSTLLRGEEAGAVLTNYTKDGRTFRNRLRVGPIMDGGHATHFVGVLQEIHDEQTRQPKMMQH